MNIWIVAAAEPLPMLDGGFRPFRCSLLADSLVKREHDVTWWTSDFDHMRKAPRFGRFESVRIGPRLAVNLLPGPRYYTNISIRRVIHNQSVGRHFQQHAQGLHAHPDLIFACLPTLELAERAVDYAATRRIPVVVDVRDLWPDLYLRAFPELLRTAARVALTSEFRRARRILRCANSITAVSQGYLDWALTKAGRSKAPGDRVFALGHALQARPPDASLGETRKKYGIPPEALTVVFVGTFGASYDLTTVINAAVASPNVNGVPLHFVLAGDGDDSSRLRRKAQEAGNVTFTGWLDEGDIVALLHASDIGLAAYGRQAMQSLPNKLFEYMAAGLPILSSLEGEQRHFIEQHRIGLHYEPHSVASLVNQLKQLASHSDERTTMGARAARVFRESYSADTIYAELAEHLELEAARG